MTHETRKMQEAAARKAKARAKIEKLECLANDAGATRAEAENARQKASALAGKGVERGWILPRTTEELLARRKKPGKPGAKHHDNETDNATKLENARLRARVAELEKQLARANETKPLTKGNVGRPCKGDRPMTGYERLKAYRARQRANANA
jgi:hypothetical protein